MDLEDIEAEVEAASEAVNVAVAAALTPVVREMLEEAEAVPFLWLVISAGGLSGARRRSRSGRRKLAFDNRQSSALIDESSVDWDANRP